MENETTFQFVAILVTVAGMLSWIMQTVIKYFIKTANDNTTYIEKLVGSNQSNVENFVNTINHQRTLDREMQQKNSEAINRLTNEISTTNAINKELVSLLKMR